MTKTDSDYTTTIRNVDTDCTRHSVYPVHEGNFKQMLGWLTRGQCFQSDGITMVGGMQRTPERFLKAMYHEWLRGYDYSEDDVREMLTQFDAEGYDEQIILQGIEFYSLCEHHLAPFSGVAHIAYIPGVPEGSEGIKIAGISKLARVLDIYSRRLQNQERIAMQVTTALDKYLGAAGSACILKAKHHCVCSRGVGKQHSIMGTSCLTGKYRSEPHAKIELLQLIGA